MPRPSHPARSPARSRTSRSQRASEREGLRRGPDLQGIQFARPGTEGCEEAHVFDTRGRGAPRVRLPIWLLTNTPTGTAATYALVVVGFFTGAGGLSNAVRTRGLPTGASALEGDGDSR